MNNTTTKPGVLAELASRATPDFGIENVQHATDCREWVVANGAAVEQMANALAPFAAAYEAASQYGVVMTAADLGALAKRHLFFVDFSAAARSLAAFRGGA